jgi:SAM-dependent methyltransferase
LKPAEPQRDYSTRLDEEQRFYKACERVHDLPDIFHYWSNKYVRPKLEAVGLEGSTDFFYAPLRSQCERNAGRCIRFLSIGSGNCDVEIEIATKLLAAGQARFVIDCLDLNDAMLARGRLAARSQGVSAQLDFITADFNQWSPTREYDGVIAIQALHHVVNLEGLFAGIKQSLTRTGCFVVSDMIGRNGHMRWPEALPVIHEFWRKLPPSYRYNHQLRRYEELFEDWDCSQEGFEGVRAQDILPLLIEAFHFKQFVAYANVIAPFVDRSFGHNFDADAAWDRAFIDQIHQRDEELLRSGTIKPTQMLAILGTEADAPTQFLEPFSPPFCVRWPDETGELQKADAQTATTQNEDERGQAAYEWHRWPHSAQRELEIACRRLAELEACARRQREEIQAWKAEVLRYGQEFDERTRWALQLDKELGNTRELVARLNRELEQRTAWALKLDRELQEKRGPLTRGLRSGWRLLKRAGASLRSKKAGRD